MTERGEARAAESDLRARAGEITSIPSTHLVQICDAMGVAVVGLSFEGLITRWPAAAETLLGFHPADVCGKAFATLFPAGSRASEILGNLLKGQPTYETPLRCRTRAGEAVPIALSMFAPSDGVQDNVRFVALMRDTRTETGALAELRSASDEQSRTQDLLSAVIDNSNSAIYVKDLDGRYLLVNREWERVVGVPREQAVGFLDTEVFPPAMAERFRLHDRVVISERRTLEFEERGPAVAGEERTFKSARVPLFGPGGEVERICGFSTDITDNKASQAVMDIARQAAESANRSKTEFLSRMSHELRTPLNVVLGFAQVLQLDDLSEDQKESVDHILKAGRHLLDMIDEVLDLSQIESNRLPLSIEALAAGEMLREVLGLVGSLAAERKITLLFGSKDAGHHVRADRQRIKQVMLNLLSNSIKYNRDGGTVTVSWESHADNRFRILVADTGIGIRADRMDRLFDPFDRLGAEATAIEGTGLGLALSQRLARAMGGEIGATSVLGEGTTFWVDLPVADDPVEAHGQGPDGTESLLTPVPIAPERTILYIEDNLANVHLVERLLRRVPGARLLPAMQGSLGLDLAREHRPDLIVLDLHLPDMPGERVLAELIADPRTRGIPVVAASADATPRSIERLLAAGATAYLTKPFDINEFLRVVQELGAPRT